MGIYPLTSIDNRRQQGVSNKYIPTNTEEKFCCSPTVADFRLFYKYLKLLGVLGSKVFYDNGEFLKFIREI